MFQFESSVIVRCDEEFRMFAIVFHVQVKVFHKRRYLNIRPAFYGQFILGKES